MLMFGLSYSALLGGRSSSYLNDTSAFVKSRVNDTLALQNLKSIMTRYVCILLTYLAVVCKFPV